MYSFDLLTQQIPEEFSTEIQPRELIYIRIKGLKNLDSATRTFIEDLSKKSSEVMISIPAEDFGTDAGDLLNSGIKGFSLRFLHEPTKWLKHQGRGYFNAGDREIVEFFRKCQAEMPKNKTLVTEFEVGDDIRVLGATIAGLYIEGMSWTVLNPTNPPTIETCEKFSELFEYIKIRNCPNLNIYFPFWKNESSEWDIKTKNIFAGIEYVHIDISNRCTHSCTFCGLYGPEAIEGMKRKWGGTLPEMIINKMKQEIDDEKCFKIIESLPWSVKAIQFGGLGEPLMHKSAVKFIIAARSRGFSVEILSNMEGLEEQDIIDLSHLGDKDVLKLHFIANISGGDPETYIRTRPKQTLKNFNKIIHNLKRFKELRDENNGKGVHTTLMCVVSRDNCTSLKAIAELAYQTGAWRLWYKPLEIHSDIHEKQVPGKEISREMAISMKEGIEIAEMHGIDIRHKDVCEMIIKKHLSDDGVASSEIKQIAVIKVATEHATVANDFYDSNPCFVGYSYIRFEVNGNIVPCCIAKHRIGNAYSQDWREVWHSSAYETFRKKLAKIHTQKFHLNDPEWTFCQQCSHLELNKQKNSLISIPR